MRRPMQRRTLRILGIVLLSAVLLWLIFAVWPDWLVGSLGRKKTFVNTLLNGVTLAGLYFLVASGFTLVFGLMRNVNLAHGSMYLLGGYIGYEIVEATGSWFFGLAVAFLAIAASGILLQAAIFRRMEGDELRQTLVTIGISIIAADLMLAVWGGTTYQFDPPEGLYGAVVLPVVSVVKSSGAPVFIKYPMYRLTVLGVAVAVGIGLWLFLNRTRIGVMIRAGVNDREMLAASGVNVHFVFALVFAIGAGLAGFCRRGRRHGPVDRAGRGYPLSARLAGRRHRRRPRLGDRRRHRRAADRPRRAVRPRLFPDLRRGPDLSDHGRRPRHPAPGHHGDALRCSAGHACRGRIGQGSTRRC